MEKTLSNQFPLGMKIWRYGLWLALFGLCLSVLVWSNLSFAANEIVMPKNWLSRDEVANYVEPPYAVGKPVEGKEGVWTIVNLDGKPAGYAFETAAVTPLPGFAGYPINVMVVINNDGVILKIGLIHQHEPVFVSGLGEPPLVRFLESYRGHNLTDTIIINTSGEKKDSKDNLVFLDNVSKATASIRIAHSSIIGSALTIAREQFRGVKGGQQSKPNPNYRPSLSWDDLKQQGIAHHFVVKNREAQKAFENTAQAYDDEDAVAKPDENWLDLWIIDLGPPSIAKAVLSESSLTYLHKFQEIYPHDEAFLLIESGRHGLVPPNFVRNTPPTLLAIRQDNLPVDLRDADLDLDLRPDLPQGVKMVFRTDRRLGFDPSRPHDWIIKAERKHGVLLPDIAIREFTTSIKPILAFYETATSNEDLPPWLLAIKARLPLMIITGFILCALVLALSLFQTRLAKHRYYTLMRLGFLAIMLGFIGWYGQGQLSIVTIVGLVMSAREWVTPHFLLYDPFSLLIWIVSLLALVVWGRGFFCGWLCPFGAMQEFAHHLGRLLRLPSLTLPASWDRYAKYGKFISLAFILASAAFYPQFAIQASEIEPFKTAITVHFLRELPFVIYAVILLVASMIVFKAYCRYLCPLGAFFALGDILFRRVDWIDRRPDCGSPCQLCKVRCRYQSIEKSGIIDYKECFQCLDCVSIYHDERKCVPLVNAAKRLAVPTKPPKIATHG